MGGPGEVTFAEIVKALKQNKNFNDINGILYQKNGMIYKTAARQQVEDLDMLPFPDRSDFDVNQFSRITDKESATALVITSRGCPYNCTFCDNRNRFYKTRSPDYIVNELLECKQMGYRSIMFWDEVLTLNRQHIVSLCKEMMEQNLDMPWGCITRVDCVDEEIIRLMGKAGCNNIFFGVESGNQHILDQINKKISLQQCRDAFRICRQEGMATGAYFIVGFPGETKAEIIKTLKFAEALDADYVYMSICYPMPGTELFEQTANEPSFDHNWWQHYVLNPSPDQQIVSCISCMSGKELAGMVRRFYRRYYLNPRRVFRLLKRFKVRGGFLIKSQMALHILLGR